MRESQLRGGDERRDESEQERLDRNLDELTGELRVVVTGVQVLFAFLLIVPFNTGFQGVGPFERAVYAVTLLLAAIAAVCLIAPAAEHRWLFRHDVLVLLAVLADSDEDLYGYEIAKRLASANDGTSIFKEGTIYPVLRALSAGNLLTSRIVPSYSGPPRRYYRITDQGRGVLAEWKMIWRGTRDFVDRFTEAENSGIGHSS